MDLNTQQKTQHRPNMGIISAILISVLLIIFAFGFGYHLGAQKKEAQPQNNEEVTYQPSKEEIEQQRAEEEALKAKEEQAKKLNELGNEFISITSKRHPDADWSILIKDLDTGNEFVYNNKKMNSASLIKLFMMETVLKSVENGSFTLTDGEDGYKIALEKMITESNNDASTKFIDAFEGYDEEKRKVTENHIINKTIKESGYEHTELNRKMHNTTPPGGPSGYQNYTSVKDVATLYENLYNGTLLSAENNELALKHLKNQERTHKIPKKINEKYPDIVVANKTGELADIENDAAIIMGKDFNVIFVVMTEDKSEDVTQKEKIQNTISDLGLKLVEFYLD